MRTPSPGGGGGHGGGVLTACVALDTPLSPERLSLQNDPSLLLFLRLHRAPVPSPALAHWDPHSNLVRRGHLWLGRTRR